MKKKRKAREIRIPLMSSTLDAIMSELHWGLMAAELNSLNTLNFDRIAAAMNLCSVALSNAGVCDPVIQGAVRAMQEVEAVYSKSGVWVMSELRRGTVTGGIMRIEELLPTLTVNDLVRAQLILKAA